MSDQNRSLTEAYLKRCFRLHTPEQKIFVCVGDAGDVAPQIEVLTKHLGWTQGDNLTDVTCIIFSIPNRQAETISDVITQAVNAEFVLLSAELGSKTVALLKRLEEQGFRILFRRGNITYLTRVQSSLKVIKEGLHAGDEEVAEFLKNGWHRYDKLSKGTVVDLCLARPTDLLVPERFDVAIKALYARLWKEGRASIWRDFAYYHQALRITGPGWGVAEHDGSGKKGMDQFLDVFQSLLSDLDPDDIPAVPADTDLHIHNGAHRVASAIVMDRDVRVLRLHGHESTSVADADFFLGNTHRQRPCPVEVLDEAAIEYCRLKSGPVLVLIFPGVASEKFAIDRISQSAKIVHRNDIEMTLEMGDVLLRQVYLGHGWTKETGENSGFQHKVRGCFPFPGRLRAILIDEYDPRDLRAMKDEIRAHYGLGNHSIHITDGDDETLRIARVLFNAASIDLMRMGVCKSEEFHQLLLRFRDWIEQHALDEEAFCINGGAILDLLGFRQNTHDIDFVYHGDANMLPALPDQIDCSNFVEAYYSHSYPVSDIVGNPRLHCWYMGVKFCTPQLIYEMKQRRSRRKDQDDVILLRTKLLNERGPWRNALIKQRIRVSGYANAKRLRLTNLIKKPLRPILQTFRRWR